MKYIRQLVLDTETTGLNPNTGERIVEIACVELINRRFSGGHLHFYINPEKESESGALAVHGLTTEFLSTKPLFAEIADQLLCYVRDAELIIHNAPFDLGFLNAEFKRLNQAPLLNQCPGVIDTLALAKKLFPGKRNSLDALCDRLGINKQHRTLHGALLDAELLAKVYLQLTIGQESMMLDYPEKSDHQNSPIFSSEAITPCAQETIATESLIFKSASPEEQAEHKILLEDIVKNKRLSIMECINN